MLLSLQRIDVTESGNWVSERRLRVFLWYSGIAYYEYSCSRILQRIDWHIRVREGRLIVLVPYCVWVYWDVTESVSSWVYWWCCYTRSESWRNWVRERRLTVLYIAVLHIMSKSCPWDVTVSDGIVTRGMRTDVTESVKGWPWCPVTWLMCMSINKYIMRCIWISDGVVASEVRANVIEPAKEGCQHDQRCYSV